MALLSPGIQEALREAGIGVRNSKKSKLSIEDALDEAGLTLESSLSVLAELQESGGTDLIRARAAETALKIRGLMKDQVQSPPSITFVFTDKKDANLDSILVPREISL